jgi:hypothetical protein
MTLSVKGCDGGGSDTYRHRTVTGTDLVAGRATAPAAVGFPDAKAVMNSAMLRGRRVALLAVALTTAGLVACIRGRRSRRVTLWIVSLSTATLCLLPGSLYGSWKGPLVDPSEGGNQTYEILHADPAGGWTVAAVASLAAASLIAWLWHAQRPRRVRPRSSARLLPVLTSCSFQSRPPSQQRSCIAWFAIPGLATCSLGWW